MSDIVKPSFSGTSEASLLSGSHGGGNTSNSLQNNGNNQHLDYAHGNGDIRINIPQQVTIKIALLCMTGTRANLTIDSAFLHHYQLQCMSPQLLSISAFKQVIYDEWVHALAVASARHNSEKLGEDVVGAAETTAADITDATTGGNGRLDGSLNADQGVPEWAAQLAGAISPPPTSPRHIRLIYFGKVLDDPATFEDCRLVPSLSLGGVPGSSGSDMSGSGPLSATPSAQHSTFVVHLSVRPPSVSAKKPPQKGGRKNKNRSNGSAEDGSFTNGRAGGGGGNGQGNGVGGQGNGGRTRVDDGDGNGGGDDTTGSGRCCIIS